MGQFEEEPKEMRLSGLPEQWLKPWPLDDLEKVSQCPICGASKRNILHINPVDNVFRVSAGKWTLWECDECDSAYLDPQPTRESIGRAYETYYRHNTEGRREQPSQLIRLSKLRRALASGYLNQRYGTKYQSSSRLKRFQMLDSSGCGWFIEI